MIILDSNIVSALMREEPDPVIIAWLDLQRRDLLWTTAITVLEIRYGLAVMPAGQRRNQRSAAFGQVIVEDLENRILPFDQAAAEEAAALMASRQRAGRSVELRDTMIAGIALAQRATLATRNVRHFDDLTVPVMDPWHA
jgi:predicted nucleic acid-binding protein